MIKQLFSIGIIGQYLSKTYLEVKRRPIYIVKETEKDKNIIKTMRLIMKNTLLILIII